MSKRLSYVTAVFGLCLSNVYCDGGNSETVAAQEVSAIEAVEIQPAEFTPAEFTLAAAPEEQPAPATIAPVVPVTPVVMEQPFSPFTGKVKRTKVRLRANADIESPIVKELHKGELLVVNGKKGDFYAVEPP